MLSKNPGFLARHGGAGCQRCDRRTLESAPLAPRTSHLAPRGVGVGSRTNQQRCIAAGHRNLLGACAITLRANSQLALSSPPSSEGAIQCSAGAAYCCSKSQAKFQATPPSNPLVHACRSPGRRYGPIPQELLSMSVRLETTALGKRQAAAKLMADVEAAVSRLRSDR